MIPEKFVENVAAVSSFYQGEFVACFRFQIAKDASSSLIAFASTRGLLGKDRETQLRAARKERDRIQNKGNLKSVVRQMA